MIILAVMLLPLLFFHFIAEHANGSKDVKDGEAEYTIIDQLDENFHSTVSFIYFLTFKFNFVV